MFQGETGAPVAWDDLVARAAQADVVLIGENHGHELGLAFASELWADVLKQRADAVLSLEFFTRDEQSRLDAYLAGIWDEESFRKATNKVSEAAYPAGHRAMVEAAKAAGRPVIASNAPRIYVRVASRESFEKLASLSASQRTLYRIPDALPTGRYRQDFDAIMSSMGSHGDTPPSNEQVKARLDASFRAQSLWDWTMADSIATAMASGGPVVQVVGRFHSDFRGGLYEALVRLEPQARIVIVSVVDADADALREEDRGRGDVVVYVGEFAPP